MRSQWQEHIRKTHARLCRKNKDQKYHASMREASKSWGKEKVKIIKRNKRKIRATQKTSASSKADTNDSTSVAPNANKVLGGAKSELVM